MRRSRPAAAAGAGGRRGACRRARRAGGRSGRSSRAAGGSCRRPRRRRASAYRPRRARRRPSPRTRASIRADAARHDQDRARSFGSHDPPRRFDPVEFRHDQVHQHDIGRLRGAQLDGLRAPSVATHSTRCSGRRAIARRIASTASGRSLTMPMFTSGILRSVRSVGGGPGSWKGCLFGAAGRHRRPDGTTFFSVGDARMLSCGGAAAIENSRMVPFQCVSSMTARCLPTAGEPGRPAHAGPAVSARPAAEAGMLPWRLR